MVGPTPAGRRDLIPAPTREGALDRRSRALAFKDLDRRHRAPWLPPGRRFSYSRPTASREGSIGPNQFWGYRTVVAFGRFLDLDAVRAQLEARRDRDRQRLGVLAERPELGSAVSFGKRIGDGTSEAVSRLTDIGVGESLERGLDRTERALTKLDEGTYGICDVCGEPISRGRLKAMPDGVLCLDCSASERRVRPPRRR